MKKCDRCNAEYKESHINFYPSLNENVCDFCLLDEQETEYEDYFYYITHLHEKALDTL